MHSFNKLGGLERWPKCVFQRWFRLEEFLLPEKMGVRMMESVMHPFPNSTSANRFWRIACAYSRISYGVFIDSGATNKTQASTRSCPARRRVAPQFGGNILRIPCACLNSIFPTLLRGSFFGEGMCFFEFPNQNIRKERSKTSKI